MKRRDENTIIVPRVRKSRLKRFIDKTLLGVTRRTKGERLTCTAQRSTNRCATPHQAVAGRTTDQTGPCPAHNQPRSCRVTPTPHLVQPHPPDTPKQQSDSAFTETSSVHQANSVGIFFSQRFRFYKMLFIFQYSCKSNISF